MSKRKIASGVVVILLISGSVWAWMRRPDPEVARVKQLLQAEVAKPNATPDQRRQTFQLVHQEMEKLSPTQRREVGQQLREGIQQRRDQQIAAYFALPPQQRVAYLDKEIKQMEQRRKEMEARRAQSGQSGAGNAGGWRGGPGGAQAGGGPQANNGPRPPRDNSPEARATRRVEHLDRSTPDQRAMRSAYRADIQKRRAQLGLPPMTGRGGRPH